jgi:hypothetical protein
MSKLLELKESILADGVIDEAEVKQLCEVLYFDGKIDKEEAEVKQLREVLYVREVLYINGKIDKEEADFLFELGETIRLLGRLQKAFPNCSDWLCTIRVHAKIQGDGQLDKVKKTLLVNLKSKAAQFLFSLDKEYNL